MSAFEWQGLGNRLREKLRRDRVREAFKVSQLIAAAVVAIGAVAAFFWLKGSPTVLGQELKWHETGTIIGPVILFLSFVIIICGPANFFGVLWQRCVVWPLRDLLMLSVIGYAGKKSLDILKVQRNAILAVLADNFFQFAYLLRRKKMLYIVYSDRPESPAPAAVDLEYASFPIDEAAFIMRTWALASAYLHWDSIELNSHSEITRIREGVEKENVILVGGSTHNTLAEQLMNKARAQGYSGYSLHKETVDFFPAILKEKTLIRKVTPARDYKPERIDGKNDRFYDYALVSRIQNPYGLLNSLFFFVGCTRAAQKALTEWFYDPSVLQRLCDHFRVGSVEVVVRVECKWKGDARNELEAIGRPEVVEPEELRRKL